MLRFAAPLFLALSTIASASAQECADLTIDFTGTKSAGGTLTIDVDAQTPMALVLFATGTRPGETCVELGPLGGFCLGLEHAFLLLPIGATDDQGQLHLSVGIPPAPAWSGSTTVEVLSVQAVLVTASGFAPGGFGGGPPALTFCTSDVESRRVP